VNASAFEKIYRAECVHLEIEDGDISGLVVRRLSGAMDNKIETVNPKEFFECGTITDVDLMVREFFRGLAETIEVPGGIAWLPKKDLAHIVVYTVDSMALAVKVFDGLRAN
jgi:hypothetical protein